MTIPKARALLRNAATALSAQGIDTARLDTEVLLAHCLSLSRSALLARLPDLELPGIVAEQFNALIARRMAYEPVAYLTGSREFWSLDFEVGPGVLIPRPDSEILIETACVSLSKHASLRVLDLGTGPGTLLLTLLHEFPNATGVGVDCSDIALGFAKRNAVRLGLTDRAAFQPGNWLESVSETFDLVVCNPPYISVEERQSLMPDVVQHEPHVALFAEKNGLAIYQQLLPDLAKVMQPTGLALLEFGATQAAAVAQLAKASGFCCRIVPDLSGQARCAALALPA